MRFRVPLIAGLFFFGLAHVAHPAEACTPPPPGFSQSMPPTNALVPPNVVWLVTGYEVNPVRGAFLDFDVFLPLDVTLSEGIYELRNGFGSYADFGGASVMAESERGGLEPIYADLRITDDEDHEPPTLIDDLAATFEYLPDEPGLCQPGGFHVIVTTSGALDPYGIGAYYLYEVAGDERRFRASRLGHEFESSGRLNLRALEGERIGRHCYVVDAVDFAGNIARGRTPVCVDLRTGPVLDAGVVDSGPTGSRDAGSQTDSGSNNPQSGLELTRGRGCACSVNEAGARSSGWTVLFAALVAGIVRRRGRSNG